MKKLFFTFVLCVFWASYHSQEQQDFLNVPDLTFAETKHFLANATQKSKILYIQDYVLENERLEDASYTLSIYFFNKNIDAKEAAEQKLTELESRQSTDKYCTYNLTESPDGKEFVIDFFTSNVSKEKNKDQDQETKEETSEYNIYRFKNVKIAENDAFIIVAYKQNYIGDSKYYAKFSNKNRAKLLEGIITMKIPEVTLKQ